MINIRPLPLVLALSLGLASTASFAATDMNGTQSKPHSEQSTTDHKTGTTAGHGTSTNAPGGTGSNDSSDTGTNSDAANTLPKPKNNDGSTNSLPGTDQPAKQ